MFCFLCYHRKTKHTCFYGPELRQKANPRTTLTHVPQTCTSVTRPCSQGPGTTKARFTLPLALAIYLSQAKKFPRKLFWTTQQWTVRDGSSESQQVFREQHHGLCFVNSFVQCVVLRNRVAIILTNYKMISESTVLD